MKIVVVAVAALLSSVAPASASPSYTLSNSIALGAPDRWDYVVFDAPTNRVYVAHADRLAVIDAASEKLLGEVEGISGGTHGTAVSTATGQGFTDDGRNGKAVAFDLKTLKVIKEIPADQDADALALDPITARLFVVEGDPAALTVVDSKTDAPIGTIKAGEKLEYAVADDHGSIYVAGEANGDVLKIDARSNRIVGRWPTPGCTSPHGLAIDTREHRAFMGCINGVLMVVDTMSGRNVATLPIGKGSDAVAFDPVRKRVFSSNGGDGTITVYQQVSPDRYTPLAPIPTVVSARTMSVDPKTGRLFVAGADTHPDPAGGRPKVRPGTLRLLVFKPSA
jgi:DNA-binding beta-propeller fold protein YncE